MDLSVPVITEVPDNIRLGTRRLQKARINLNAWRTWKEAN
jgi:hypothetical protein